MIQRAVCQHLEIRCAPGVVAFAIPNGGWRSPVEAAILKATGVRKGFSDLGFIKAGRLYLLEVKAPDGKPTAEQAECLAQCEAAGATVAIEYGLDACLARLEAWSILRGRADALSVI